MVGLEPQGASRLQSRIVLIVADDCICSNSAATPPVLVETRTGAAAGFGCIGGARRFLHNRPHRNCPRNYRNYRRHHCPHLLCPTGNTIGGAWSNNISNYNDFVNYQRIGRFGFRLGHRTLSRATLVPDLIDDTRSPRRGIVAQLQWRLPLAVDVRLRSGIDRRQNHYVHCRRAEIRWIAGANIQTPRRTSTMSSTRSGSMVG